MQLYHLYDVESNTPLLFEIECTLNGGECRDYFSIVSATNTTEQVQYVEELYNDYCDDNEPVTDLNSTYYLQAS